MAGAQCGAGSEAHAAHASAHSAAPTSATTRTAALGIAIVAPLAATTGRGAGRPLRRNPQVGRNRRQIQRFAHEVAQRDHQFVDMHRPPLCQFVGGTRRQSHLFVGAQQQDVRERGLDRIADAARSIRTRFGDAFGRFALAQIAAMAGIHAQFTSE